MIALQQLTGRKHIYFKARFFGLCLRAWIASRSGNGGPRRAAEQLLPHMTARGHCASAGAPPQSRRLPRRTHLRIRCNSAHSAPRGPTQAGRCTAACPQQRLTEDGAAKQPPPNNRRPLLLWPLLPAVLHKTAAGCADVFCLFVLFFFMAQSHSLQRFSGVQNGAEATIHTAASLGGKKKKKVHANRMHFEILKGWREFLSFFFFFTESSAAFPPK